MPRKILGCIRSSMRKRWKGSRTWWSWDTFIKRFLRFQLGGNSVTWRYCILNLPNHPSQFVSRPLKNSIRALWDTKKVSTKFRENGINFYHTRWDSKSLVGISWNSLILIVPWTGTNASDLSFVTTWCSTSFSHCQVWLKNQIYIPLVGRFPSNVLG